MTRISSAILATAVFAAAASAQQCVAKQTQCATDNDSILLHCDGSTWATSRCASDQYCMTMMPGMVHCMLRPEGEKPGPSTPTSASSSSKPTGSSTTGPSPTSDSKPKPTSETSKDSGAAANKAAAIGLGVVAVALVALF
ncbi:hypothetical protein GGI09_005194 [Coemansia sp. S100]|nr:hypothetical protein LPJ71_009837 [Coemansia sp. S17]KAJ2094825.1 hypothetical protein GGI09_005194 [Coemansia sp. S100]KAJ2095128.1 hypothetical protein GGI16_005319 [Coemansia sp. S142-1]